MNDYIWQLLRHLEATDPAPGKVHHVEVRHDEDCGIWNRQPCDCEPDVESGARIDRRYDDNEPEEGGDDE